MSTLSSKAAGQPAGSPLSSPSGSDTEAPILKVEGLTKFFPGRRRLWKREAPNRGIEAVSFQIPRGSVSGIVGQSGSGKTTLLRSMVRLTPVDSGRVVLNGEDIVPLSPEELRVRVRPRMRMIFQHPDAVLNPALSVEGILDQALSLHTSQAPAQRSHTIDELLEAAGLGQRYRTQKPGSLSGGEKRRVSLCRALATSPELLVADEPLSGLDLELQDQLLGLLLRTRRDRNLTLIMVSHDLPLVRQVSDLVLVLYSGRLVEVAKRAGTAPPPFRHPYSRLLLAAADLSQSGSPESGSGRDSDLRQRLLQEEGSQAADGEARSSGEVGCPFRSRCPRWRALGEPELCATTLPTLASWTAAAGGSAACHFVEENASD